MLRARWANVVKVVSVALGILLSALLLSAVAWNRSFDRCFRDSDRLYTVWSTIYYGDEMVFDHAQTSVGRLAEAMLADMHDDIESATTVSFSMSDFPIVYGGNEFAAYRFAADSMFFDTMGMEVLSGNPREDLKGMDVIYLSDELARRMFGEEDPIGKTVIDTSWEMTVRGVFKALPDNTTRSVSAVISLPTLLTRYNGGHLKQDWDTPNVYRTYFRTYDPHVDLDRMQARVAHLMQSNSADRSWRIDPEVRLLRDTYMSSDEVRRMTLIMAVLAVAILSVTVLNYILITLASLGRRAKAIGVHKCNGASSGSIFGMFMTETAIVIGIALLLMGGIVLYTREFIEQALRIQVSSLFAMERLWITAAVVAVIFVVGGVVPARVFSRVHVTTVFRGFTDRRSRLKQILLAVEFASVAFIFGVMCVVIKQYSALTGTDLGYQPDMVAVGPNPSMGEDGCRAAMAFFKGLPYVEDVTSSLFNPAMGYATAVYTDESGRDLFTYGMNAAMGNFADLIGMRMIAGRAPESYDEVAVSESFAKLLWPSEQAVGMSYDSYGNRVTVSGVYADVTLIGFYQEPIPTVLEYEAECGSRVFVKLKEPVAENLRRLNEDAHEAYPMGCPADSFTSHARMNRMRYTQVLAFRNMAVLAWVSITVITMMGLIGYIADEIRRRSKEIAVRKVNGATAANVVWMLTGDLAKVAVPAVALGAVAAWYVGEIWLRTFYLKVGFASMLVAVELLLLVVIVTAVAAQTYRVAVENPVNKLKYE